jgi:UrcA family protein
MKFLPLAVFLVAGVSASGAVAQQRVAYGDLDLSSPTGATAFDARVDRAARRLCGGRVPLSVQVQCRNAVRDEAMSGLPDARRTDYARARRGERLMVQAVNSPAYAV